VRDGQEALDQLLSRAERPAVIFLDLMMPRMSGVQFLTARRRDPSLRDIPVIVLTAWTNRMVTEYAPDVDGVLSKPFDSDKLLAIVSRYCDAETKN
jgi:CheY-like chemotaxis protein